VIGPVLFSLKIRSTHIFINLKYLTYLKILFKFWNNKKLKPVAQHLWHCGNNSIWPDVAVDDADASDDASNLDLVLLLNGKLIYLDSLSRQQPAGRFLTSDFKTP